MFEKSVSQIIQTYFKSFCNKLIFQMGFMDDWTQEICKNILKS